MFSQLLTRLIARIPSQCAVCHRWPAPTICEACVRSLGQPVHRCRSCAIPLQPALLQCAACVAVTPSLDQALAALPYDFPWSDLIVRFKFHEGTGLARSFATLLRSTPWVEPALDAANWVIPMPLSNARLRQRGFNQTLLLARALEPRKTRADILLRVKETPPQSTLARHERLASVRGAYAVEPLRFNEVQGKRVLLLDDVMTTGASLADAARALRGAGAAHLTALVLARAE